MQLKLKNIGKIKDAIINIDGLTIIAGENNTGKSTISKALFAIFNGLFQLEENIVEAKVSNIISTIFRLSDLMRFMSDSSLTEMIKKSITNENIEESIDEILLLLSEIGKDRPILIDQENIKNSLKESLSISDETIRNQLINNQFNIEFDNQINRFLTSEKGSIELSIKGKISKISFEDNKLFAIENDRNINNQAIYIDDPFILDLSSQTYPYRRRIQDHRTILLDLLRTKNLDTLEQIKVDKKLETIFNKLNSITSGELVKGRFNTLEYKEKADHENIKMRNTSSGLKTFLIIKTLLQNSVLGQNGVLILDEPEIHLHPEWQTLLAEIIVLIQKEFNLHILLTTHSPYFLYGIEVFSAQYAINQRCHYYLSEVVDNDVEFIDVSHNIELIYQKLSKPFQKLEDLRSDIE